eukprot:3525741-Amphidinium_carterae.1
MFFLEFSSAVPDDRGFNSDALRLYSEMRGRGMELDRHAASAAIVALEAKGEWQHAIGTLQVQPGEMMGLVCQHGLTTQPNAFPYITSVHVITKCLKSQEKKFRISSTLTCCHLQDRVSLPILVQELFLHGLAPNSKGCEKVLAAIEQGGQWELALQVMDEMWAAGSPL